MVAPPVTRKEYWDRILKLHKETDGHFTLDQVQNALGLSSAQVDEAMSLAVPQPPLDNTDVYESARDAIYSWTSSLMAEIYTEKGQYLQALEQIMSAATQERAALDIQNPTTTVAVTAKYIALNKSFRAADANGTK